MERYQAVVSGLKAINDTVFQELCDKFLVLRNNNYAAFSRTGSQEDKQKTTKGTPDSFFLLPNGKYLFVEATTNSTDKNKLENDIKACFDSKKSKISVDKIEEIILCFNWNIDQAEVERLSTIAKNLKRDIRLTFYSLDALAIELHLNHRDLVHEYLNLPLDTGQIVSIEKFINEYNRASKGVATPLDNQFLHRENELKELKESIDSHDFIILTGAPGIGKTKLALEGIKSFISENSSFKAYCVSYKNHTLLDDLYQYFDSDKDYLLFVDDANRIDAFNQITGFYRAERTGALKIIITVRDYAFQDIGTLCQDFSPIRLDLHKLSDNQIIDIIKAEPFEILNSDYQKEIIRIADGNPRLAIMTALLAKAEQNIYALSDVSELFEKYFSTFVKDEGEFANDTNIKCLGIIAFFYTIPYKDKEITSPILEHFSIEYSDFIDSIDKLDRLELVEIKFDHVKIPEQNLSTYFFYKAFIKDDLLSFSTLLDRFFETNRDRFRDCVIPANNTFGPQNVMEKLQPFLQNHWKSIKHQEKKALNFLATFWFYMQTETLEYIYNLIMSMPLKSSTDYEVAHDNNLTYYEKNDIIEILGQFLRYPSNLKDAIELGFEYIRKKPEFHQEWLDKITEKLTFDREDEIRYRFERQKILFQVILDGLNNDDSLLSKCFYELSKTFLSFKFSQTRSARNNSVYLYDYPLPNTSLIHDIRQDIWNAIDTHFSKNPEESFEVLQSYANVTPMVVKEIMEYDVPFVIKIIKNHLTKESFEHCKFVQEQLRWFKRNDISNRAFDSLSSTFTNSTYEIYKIIEWDRLRDKESYEFNDYREYEKLKEVEIRNAFIFKNKDEVKDFYESFAYLRHLAEKGKEWGYINSLDYIIDENFKVNFELGCHLIREIIYNENKIEYIPRVVFKNQLQTSENANIIWSILKDYDFNQKSIWELSYYANLEESLISEAHIGNLMQTFSTINTPNIIFFDGLEKFLRIDNNLFYKLLKIIVNRIENEDVKLFLWSDFFNAHFENLGDDIELIKKAYMQQDEIHNHIDYQGAGFLKILKEDTNFLLEYIESFYLDNDFGISKDSKDFTFVWKVDEIEKNLYEVFDLISVKEPFFGISDHFCNGFFRNLKEDTKERAKQFLFQYCEINYKDPKKINIVVDVIRNSMNEYFEELLLFFLTLNQDVEIFSNISWRGTSTSGIGNDVILADIEMADWKKIQSIVEKSDLGIKLIPIKQYLNDQIERCQRSGDWERKRKFLHNF